MRRCADAPGWDGLPLSLTRHPSHLTPHPEQVRRKADAPVVDWGLRAVERAVGLAAATAAAAAAAATAAEVWVEAEEVEVEEEEEAEAGEEEEEVVVYCTPRLARHATPLHPVAHRTYTEIGSPFVATVHARLLAISCDLIAAWRQRACSDLLLRCVWRWVACCAASVHARRGAIAAVITADSMLLRRHGRVVKWRRWLTKLQQLCHARQCGERLHARYVLRLWRRTAARPRTMRTVTRQRTERGVRAALLMLLAFARRGLVAAGRLRVAPEPLRRAWCAWARPVRWHRRACAAVVAMGYRSRGTSVIATVVAWRRYARRAARDTAAWRAAVAMAKRTACASALLRWQRQPRQPSRAMPYLLAARHYVAAGDRHSVGRAFGVWAGGAAAVNLWLRAAVARWARNQSWAFVHWTKRAARWREVRAVLLQASVTHRRRALVGAAVVWFGPTVRRRRVMACAVRWRGATMMKALCCWREAAAVAATAAAVAEVCTAAAARATLALAWAELWQRARCAARAEAGWRAHVGRRSLRRWRAAASWGAAQHGATLALARRLRGGCEAALSAWREAAAASRVARERQQVAQWLWVRLEAVSALASLRRHARSCARRRRALLLLLATTVARWRGRVAQLGACAAMVARAALEAVRLAARRAWAQWRAAHDATLQCASARLRCEGLRCNAAWRTWQAAAAARRLHSFWAAAVAAQGAAASLRGTVSRWRHAEPQPLLACGVVASRSGGAAASVVRRAFGLWARTTAAWYAAVAVATRVACVAALRRWQQQMWQHSPHLPAIVSGLQLLRGWRQLRRQAAAGRTAVALMLLTGRARGRLAALRTVRAFGVWAGGAAAVNLWLRAAAARWAQSKSWAFVQWTKRAARQREARALLLQASVTHRRRALVGAAVAWRDTTVRRRFLLRWVLRWRSASVAKVFARWTERALQLRDARAVLLQACEEAGLRGVQAPARQLALYAHGLRAMARGMAAWHRQVTRQRHLKRRVAARWRVNQVCAPWHQLPPLDPGIDPSYGAHADRRHPSPMHTPTRHSPDSHAHNTLSPPCRPPIPIQPAHPHLGVPTRRGSLDGGGGVPHGGARRRPCCCERRARTCSGRWRVAWRRGGRRRHGKAS